jgi:hypothetical protein
MAEATKTTAAKKSTTKKSTAKKTTAKKTTTKKAPHLFEREPKVLAEEAAYVAAALLQDTLDFAKDLPTKVDEYRGKAPKLSELREQAPENAKKARESLTSKVEELRGQLESRVTEIRDRAKKEFDSRLSAFEKTFDSRAKEGKKDVDEFRKSERVSKIEGDLKKVWDQTENSRSQVKAAITSVRKTADVAVDAGRKQAKTAESQVKAAATSVRKTVDTVVEAGKDIAS